MLDSDPRYSFGNSLRDAIIEEKIVRTPLRDIFEEKVYQKTGIEMKYSSFYAKHQPFLCLSVDTQKYPESFLESRGCEKFQGIFYPRGDLFWNFLACVNEAAETLHLPNIQFPANTTITIMDYDSTSKSIYFSVRLYMIEQDARIRFPRTKYILRQRYMTSPSYSLIFSDDTERFNAERRHVTERLIAFIDRCCKSRDPLHIFGDELITPEFITTKKALEESGEAMGICRNNTMFTEW